MRLKQLSINLLIIQLVVLAVLQPPNVASAQADEYVAVEVVNPGFELVNEDGTFPGWNINVIGEDDGLQTEALIETDAQFVKSGNQSVKLVDHSPKKGMEFKSDRISIEGGNFYRLKTEVYAEAKSVRIYIKYFNEKGVAIPGAEGNILANTPKVWKTEQLEVYAPMEAEFAEIWYYKSPAGAGTIIYLDDVELAKKVETEEAELEIPYGDKVEDLGEMVKIGLSQAAMFATGKDGKLYHYITTSGTPSAFAVVDALTGEEIFTERVVGANDTIWGIDQGSDGNIYFAAAGKLFRYVVEDQKIETLGTNPTGNTTMYDIKASTDGKIYGSTFHATNQGKVFEYDIATNEFKDLGVAKEGQNYARGLGVTDEYVYIGVGEYSHLMRYDRQSGETIEIEIPEVSGTKRMLSQVEIFNGKLFVYAGDRVHVLNEENYEYIRTIDFQNKISPPASANPNLIYFKKGEELFSYDLTKDEVEKVSSIDQALPDTEFKAQQWLTPSSGKFAGREVLFSMAAYGETIVFDPVSGEYATHVAELPAIGTQINTLEHKDGLLYMGGFQRGMSIYDVNSQQLIHNYPSFHQAESIGFLGGSVYFGTYTGAKMYRMNLSDDIEYNQFGWGNPGLSLQIEGQNRPYVMAEGDDKLFIGTFPSGSNFAGSLTVLEEVTDNTTGKVVDVTSKTYPNLAENRTIIGLAHHNGDLFGSTTVYSGSGSINPPPVQDNAVIFKFNPVTEQIEKTIIPEIDGIEGNIQIIGDLSVGPDGLIWGVLDSLIDSANGYQAAVFAMDPDSMEIVKSKVITKSPYSTSKYRPYYIRWGENDVMYTTIGRQLFAINAETLAAKQMLPGLTVNLMTMADNGDIYYVNNSKVYKLPKVNEVIEVSVTEVEAPKDIQVDFGTDEGDLALPETVKLTLSDDSSVEVPVTWDIGEPTYDGNVPGPYEFTGELDLSLLPDVLNPKKLAATINVFVEEEIIIDPEPEPEPEELSITKVDQLGNLTVDFGTDEGDLALPETAKLTLSDGSSVEVPVTWNNGDPAYDGNISGRYEFTGELDFSSLPDVLNPEKLAATINVFVEEEIIIDPEPEPEPEELSITKVDQLGNLTVDFGTDEGDLALPETVKLTLSDDSSVEVPVIWNNGKPAYNGKASGAYVFTGELDLSSLPNVVNLDEITATINVIVKGKVIVKPTPPEEGEDNGDETVPPKGDEEITTPPKEKEEVGGNKPGVVIDQDKDGGSLPNTATTNYNLLVIGLLLLIASSGLLLLRKKKVA